MSKKAVATTNLIVKLIVGAGQAAPSPPVGPALGSKGVKSMDFCKEFNARTTNMITGTPIPSRIIVRPDRTFTFELRTPTTSYLLFKAANVPLKKGKMKGANNPGKEFVGGEVTLKHIYEIAKIKLTETRLQGMSEKSMVKCVLRSARSAGIKVVP